ncbi:MAG: glycosyltransferase family 2 protein [Elusimicrobia bacterium]|nr:glycosyltransferase family 2 protein [Elusimicrobiota bacterium]
MTTTPELSIVIPVFNEEGNLERLAQKLGEVLAGIQKSYELIFVDDGSTDRSFSILRTLAGHDPRIRVLRFQANRGETAATDAGLKAARGTAIVTIDADLQHDPEDLPTLLAALPGADLVCGIRAKYRDTWLRHLSSLIGNTVRRWAIKDTILDIGCTFRAYRRECLQGLQLYKGLHRFIPALLALQGYRVKQVPVRHHPRYAGKAKYGVWNRIFSASYDLLAVRWMQRRRLDYTIAERIN